MRTVPKGTGRRYEAFLHSKGDAGGGPRGDRGGYALFGAHGTGGTSPCRSRPGGDGAAQCFRCSLCLRRGKQRRRRLCGCAHPAGTRPRCGCFVSCREVLSRLRCGKSTLSRRNFRRYSPPQIRARRRLHSGDGAHARARGGCKAAHRVLRERLLRHLRRSSERPFRKRHRPCAVRAGGRDGLDGAHEELPSDGGRPRCERQGDGGRHWHSARLLWGGTLGGRGCGRPLPQAEEQHAQGGVWKGVPLCGGSAVHGRRLSGGGGVSAFGGRLYRAHRG